MKLSNMDVLSVMLQIALLGFFLGFVYDIAKALRPAGKNGERALAIFDIVFWALSALVVFLFAMAKTDGEIRVYFLLFALLGAVLYRLTLGRLISAAAGKIRAFVGRILRKMKATIRKPIDCALQKIEYKERLTQRKRRRRIKNLQKDFQNEEKSCRIKDNNNAMTDAPRRRAR